MLVQVVNIIFSTQFINIYSELFHKGIFTLGDWVKSLSQRPSVKLYTASFLVEYMHFESIECGTVRGLFY